MDKRLKLTKELVYGDTSTFIWLLVDELKSITHTEIDYEILLNLIEELKKVRV